MSEEVNLMSAQRTSDEASLLFQNKSMALCKAFDDQPLGADISPDSVRKRFDDYFIDCDGTPLWTPERSTGVERDIGKFVASIEAVETAAEDSAIGVAFTKKTGRIPVEVINLRDNRIVATTNTRDFAVSGMEHKLSIAVRCGLEATRLELEAAPGLDLRAATKSPDHLMPLRLQSDIRRTLQGKDCFDELEIVTDPEVIRARIEDHPQPELGYMALATAIAELRVTEKTKLPPGKELRIKDYARISMRRLMRGEDFERVSGEYIHNMFSNFDALAIPSYPGVRPDDLAVGVVGGTRIGARKHWNDVIRRGLELMKCRTTINEESDCQYAINAAIEHRNTMLKLKQEQREAIANHLL